MYVCKGVCEDVCVRERERERERERDAADSVRVLELYLDGIETFNTQTVSSVCIINSQIPSKYNLYILVIALFGPEYTENG